MSSVAVACGLTVTLLNLAALPMFAQPTDSHHTDIAELRAKAEAGDPNSEVELSSRYGLGLGVRKNKVEAVKWLRKAAEQGDARAEWGLGRCYYVGEGVRKNRAEAARWYRKAAEQDMADAEFELGTLYHTGDGVPRNVVEAL